jgi:hypothetical protein
VKRGIALAGVVTVALLLASCGGGGSDNEPRVLEAGQVDVKLPAGYRVEARTTPESRARTDSSAAIEDTPSSTLPGQGDASSPTTATTAVPIKSSGNATEDLLDASRRFGACLSDEKVEWIGRPDPTNPQSPTNDPDYIEALTTCAARSNIIAALQAAESAQNSLTPKQIKQQNEGYLFWRECMVKRGWKIEKPTPDAKGRLFAFNENTDPPEPPPGKSFFSSKDQDECATKAQRQYEKKHPGQAQG